MVVCIGEKRSGIHRAEVEPNTATVCMSVHDGNLGASYAGRVKNLPCAYFVLPKLFFELLLLFPPLLICRGRD